MSRLIRVLHSGEKMEKNLRSVGVHDGTFHADEVSAVALLLLFDKVDLKKVVRTRDPKILGQCEFVCDVGGVYDPSKKLFDHHQVAYKGELSSAGMILRYLHQSGSISKQLFDLFHNALVHGVDLHDNGLDPTKSGFCSFSHIIANFMPATYEATPKMLDEAFFRALAFAHAHMGRMLERFKYIQSVKEVVEAEMDKGARCLFFDRPLPWLESFFAAGGTTHKAVFLIMPSGVHWKLRGIPPDLDHRMEVRVPLPKRWAGLIGQEIKEATGIEGAIFCHKGRFISVWETREDAITALNEVLKENKYEEHFSKDHR